MCIYIPTYLRINLHTFLAYPCTSEDETIVDPAVLFKVEVSEKMKMTSENLSKGLQSSGQVCMSMVGGGENASEGLQSSGQMCVWLMWEGRERKR